MRLIALTLIPFAGFLLAIAAAGAPAATANVPLTLPSVRVVRPPDLETWADHVKRIGQPRLDGNQQTLNGDAANLAVKRAEIARARAAQSAQTRALYGLGVDAMPNAQTSH